MAKIERFEELPVGGGEREHGPVECGFKILELDDRKLVQLDTYGSTERKLTGKVSQSVQLDEAGAAYLVGILQRAFPSIK